MPPLLNSGVTVRAFALRPRIAAIVAALLVLGLGCGESTAPPEPVASVAIAPSASVLLVPGGTELLVASPKGASGKLLVEREAIWSSSDASIVDVAAGLITGKAKGTARVTVSVEGISASVDVEVRDGGVASAAGVSFTVLDGSVSVVVPAGAVTQSRNISVRPALSPPPARRFVQGTAYDFGPDGATFQQPVTLTIKYDPAGVGPDSPESGLQLYEALQGAWRVVPGSTVDVSARTVSGAVSHFSTYGVLMQPIVDTVRVVGPPTSIVVRNSFLLTAVLKDSAGETLTRPIAWASSAPTIVQIDPATGAATSLLPGTVTITATSEKKSGTAVVTVVPGPPAHMLRVTPETISGSAGLAVTPPGVKVTDDFGNGISGFTVTFAVVTGGGTVTGGTATTNAGGFASPATWTLGTTVGSNTLTASAAGLPESPLTFIASANAGAPATIVANSATSQAGTAGGIVGAVPSVKVADAFGNAVAGTPVVFAPASGSGTVTGGNAITNSAGVATVGSWRLGTTSGTQTLLASVSGASGSPVTFTAAAAAPVPSAMTSVAGNGQSAITLTAVAIQPAVRVTDPAGIPVPGLAVTFAVTGGGGTISGASAVTNADGVATVGSWTLGSSPGTNTLSASAASLPSVAFTATAVAPTPVAIAIVAGQNQTATSGVPVPVAPSVRVTGAQGRVVPGITVTFTVTSGGGSVSSGSVVTNSSGIAAVDWIIGNGVNTLSAARPELSGSPITFVATGVPFIQLVTFGDSNTDLGYQGSTPGERASSYISNFSNVRLGPNAPHSPFQLAGKIEARWRASRSETIRVVNHAIASTGTGRGRTGLTSPSALEVVNGFTRFEGEVLGRGYPWSGGESTNSAFPNGPIFRVQAFTPQPQDYVYVSLGTNNVLTNVDTDKIADSLSRMVDFWVGAGLPANHFIITTLAPRGAGTILYIPGLNRAIRGLATQRGLRLIELDVFTSYDEGFSWKSADMHVGDLVHYSEMVRNWLADQVFEIIKGP